MPLFAVAFIYVLLNWIVQVVVAVNAAKLKSIFSTYVFKDSAGASLEQAVV